MGFPPLGPDWCRQKFESWEFSRLDRVGAGRNSGGGDYPTGKKFTGNQKIFLYSRNFCFDTINIKYSAVAYV